MDVTVDHEKLAREKGDKKLQQNCMQIEYKYERTNNVCLLSSYTGKIKNKSKHE